MDNMEYTRKGQKALRVALDFAESIGARSVTISLPSILPVIKRHNPSLAVRVGVYARVDSIAKAKYWEEMGADCITLESISVNRNFKLFGGDPKSGWSGASAYREFQLPDVLPAIWPAHGKPIPRLPERTPERGFLMTGAP